MKKTLLILTISIVAWGAAHAQDVYYTRDATLRLNGELGSEPLSLQTRQLSVKLDYETAYMIIRFPLKSLETSVDSLKRLLENSTLEVVFDGELSLEFINTEDHPPMKFTAEGWLTVGKSKNLVRGTGELHHVGNSTDYACMLSMVMELDFTDLNIEPPLSGLENKFEAVITQTLLQRDKN